MNYGPPPSREDDSFPRGRRGGGGGGGAGFESGNRVYVGNLSWGVDNAALESLFSEQGKVLEAKVVYDRDSGRSRGFGFVTYNTADEVNSAINSLNGVVSIVPLYTINFFCTFSFDMSPITWCNIFVEVTFFKIWKLNFVTCRT